MLYRLLLFTKLVAVLACAGGFAGAFVCATARERTEAWLLGALVLSLASLLALVHSVGRERTSAVAFATAALPLAIVLMMWRPTRQQLRGS